jgi:hypothetical protein
MKANNASLKEKFVANAVEEAKEEEKTPAW